MLAPPMGVFPLEFDEAWSGSAEVPEKVPDVSAVYKGTARRVWVSDKGREANGGRRIVLSLPQLSENEPRLGRLSARMGVAQNEGAWVAQGLVFGFIYQGGFLGPFCLATAM